MTKEEALACGAVSANAPNVDAPKVKAMLQTMFVGLIAAELHPVATGEPHHG